jgi:hypothetical protein
MIGKDETMTVEKLQLPLLLLAVAFFLLVAFQMQQVLTDRGTLKKIHGDQQTAIDQGTQIQNRLDGLAVGTLKLAEGGNKNAKGIIDRMKELGITVNPNAKPAADTKAVTTAAPAAASTSKVDEKK